jgi:hypothetical protein
MQNSRRIAHLEALGQVAKHFAIRIVFNTFNVVDSVGPDSPHAIGRAPLNTPYGKGVKEESDDAIWRLSSEITHVQNMNFSVWYTAGTATGTGIFL